jgi:hypothetical protein
LFIGASVALALPIGTLDLCSSYFLCEIFAHFSW